MDKYHPSHHKRSSDDDGCRKKRVKRSSGKACVYCRRSHMVCEGGRPCERCVKREIAHLCRDVSPPPNRRTSDLQHTKSPSLDSIDLQIQTPPQPVPQPGPPQLPTSLYSDPNFPPSWPLLPDTEGPVTFGDGGGPSDVQRPLGNDGNWQQNDGTELDALTKFLGDLGVPSLPGGFLDALSYFSRGGTEDAPGNGLPGVTLPNLGAQGIPQLGDPSQLAITQDGLSSEDLSKAQAVPQGVKGKGKEVIFPTPQLNNVSRIERYFLAAANQPTGPRASRLAQVIKAKYDAGLLKPYDYVKGYERMNKWMDSGRAAPKQDSLQGSAPSSPSKNGARRTLGLTPAYSAASISAESRRRILTALSGFRPKFRQIARTLTDVDLVFVEEAMERWMLEYDRAFASIHTPSCIWRRTGEIQKANQEFANLTGIPASMFRGGLLCVYELMDEDSAVRYWEGYAKIAFDAGQRSLTTHCTLKVPVSLMKTRAPRIATATPGSLIAKAAVGPRELPDLALPQPLIEGETYVDQQAGTPFREEYREIKCCFSVTIRRDAWGVPVAIMGQWIPI